jgi:hypothetical protein
MVAVGENEPVLAFGMAEEIEDALLFHQPADEVEIGLAVLHAVRTRGVAAGQPVVVDALVVVEDLLDDLRRRQVLEDPDVGATRQQPEPRLQLQPVREEAAGDAFEARRGDDAVEPALATGLEHVDRNRGRLAEQLVDREAAVLRDRDDLVVERARELFAGTHRPEVQHPLAERRNRKLHLQRQRLVRHRTDSDSGERPRRAFSRSRARSRASRVPGGRPRAAARPR